MPGSEVSTRSQVRVRGAAYLLSSFAPPETGVLECANSEGRLDSRLAALGRRGIGSNALLDGLGEASGREEKRSEDGGSAHGDGRGSLTS